MIFLQLFLIFFKIGLVSFGGGYGIVPVIRQEMLLLGWIDDARLLDMVGISESTPGPIAVNMATFVGYEQGAVFGVPGAILGALCATFGVVMPAFLIMLVLSGVISAVRKNACISAALDAVQAVVIGLIAATGLYVTVTAICTLPKTDTEFSFDFRAAAIAAVLVFILFLYKKLRKKSISPILLIGISAIFGIVAYAIV